MNIVPLRESNFRSISKTLRIIADGIDAGQYDGVVCATLVLNGKEIEVFHIGKGGVPDGMMTLQLGIHTLCSMSLPTGE